MVQAIKSTITFAMNKNNHSYESKHLSARKNKFQTIPVNIQRRQHVQHADHTYPNDYEPMIHAHNYPQQMQDIQPPNVIQHAQQTVQENQMGSFHQILVVYRQYGRENSSEDIV